MCGTTANGGGAKRQIQRRKRMNKKTNGGSGKCANTANANAANTAANEYGCNGKWQKMHGNQRQNGKTNTSSKTK